MKTRTWYWWPSMPEYVDNDFCLQISEFGVFVIGWGVGRKQLPLNWEVL